MVFPFRLPFIVSSRRSKALLSNLSMDAYPVIIEGIHCSYLLSRGLLANRPVVVQLHNVEYEYYLQLAMHTRNLYKKMYYMQESRLLKKYEKKLARQATFIALNQQDALTYRQKLGSTNTRYLPPFISTAFKNKTGTGTFCLYHGNLSVAENEKVCLWLIKDVFAGLHVPFVIAGKNPSHYLAAKVSAHPHGRLVSNPSEQEMEGLIADAQVHVIPSFNITGIKVKLLQSLVKGRHILANHNAVAGTGLESLCNIAGTASEFKESLQQLYETPFTNEAIQQRESVMKELYNNEKNVQELLEMLGIRL